ncbi:DUF3822 family protein [Ancylomarina longa]|uniref:DUF3822 family protein n=1 Tax=Ancylomarina longa TaxID=2487017 RepID=A0A434AYL8_9BACT|nr:DUF3822 family protein [Ancylomarina longa]RUT79640.1 DUF3822 family protein [Ancylomarina longa]
MDDFVFVDSSFDQNKTKEYNLSIQLGLDGFSFSILDSNKNCISLNAYTPFQDKSDSDPINSFKENLRNSTILNLPFQKVSVLWISQESILIPSEFFSPEFAHESYQLCHSLDKSEKLVWNKMKELDSWSVFSIPEAFKDLLESHYSNISLLHHTFPFLNTSLSQSKLENQPNVFVNVQKDFFHLIIPNPNRKHFINNFAYKEDTDLAYYILNIYKQQKLNNEKSKLILDGIIQEDSKVIQLLRKYLGQVEVRNLPSDLRMKDDIPQKEYNQFINLLNLSMCE